jgi:5-(carboxyamino)imidazole ribonucleotide synthase
MRGAQGKRNPLPGVRSEALSEFSALKPGGTIGILGGGQLARMLALAAARLGLKCHIFAPEPDSCAFGVVRRATLAEYGDEAALARFAEEVDVITYEFENVPAETAAFLSSRRRVLPDPSVLATTQDRLTEKDFVASLGIATAPYAGVSAMGDVRAAVEKIGLPAVLKTRRFGYDGKGQVKIGVKDDPARAWRSLGEAPAILERYIAFTREVSIVAARAADGEVVTFDITENEHADHILKFSRVPAKVSPAVAEEGRRIAQAIAEALNYVGTLAVELFVVEDGGDERLLVNEIAPRVHNSGHWTIDGASVSQFEQHVRAVAGWPLGKPVRRGRIEMINLIGAEIDDYAKWLEVPNAYLHVYGKPGARPGRKMGHVTRVMPETAAAGDARLAKPAKPRGKPKARR